MDPNKDRFNKLIDERISEIKSRHAVAWLKWQLLDRKFTKKIEKLNNLRPKKQKKMLFW